MKRIVISLFAAAALLSAAEGPIQQRKENQQQRIGQGIENGSVTAREASRLERKETRINRQVRHDRRVNGGILTNKQKAQVNREQNRVSRDIYRQKHDAQVQPR